MPTFKAKFETDAGDLKSVSIFAEDSPTAVQTALEFEHPGDQRNWKLMKVYRIERTLVWEHA